MDNAVARFVERYLAADEPGRAVVRQQMRIALDKYQQEEFWKEVEWRSTG